MRLTPMHGHDQNLDDALAHQEESLEDYKSVQFVISIVRASHWEETGVFDVKLGLETIAGIAESQVGGWCYSLLNDEPIDLSTGSGYRTRIEAAFAAVSHHLNGL